MTKPDNILGATQGKHRSQDKKHFFFFIQVLSKTNSMLYSFLNNNKNFFAL